MTDKEKRQFHKWLPSSIRYKLYYDLLAEDSEEMDRWRKAYQEDLQGVKRKHTS